MTVSTRFRRGVCAFGIGVALLATDFSGPGWFPSFVGEAEARIGQPWTAASGAGVARRTTRRIVRRSTTVVATLPPACVRTRVGGVRVWRCGATFYQRHGGGYVVVLVD